MQGVVNGDCMVSLMVEMKASQSYNVRHGGPTARICVRHGNWPTGKARRTVGTKRRDIVGCVVVVVADDFS